MTAAVNSSLASQCMAFCQALASQNKAFTFSLTIGSSFTFSLDTKETLHSAANAVKRKSPSTQRRNLRRRADFLQKKSQLPIAPNQVDVTLASNDDKHFGAQKVILNSGCPVEEEEVFVDAPSSLPTSLQSSTTPSHGHIFPSKPLYSSVTAASASTQVPTVKKANPLLCTHCGLSKFGHPGPTGDRCLVPARRQPLVPILP